jgi:hypothetical protein
VAGGQHGPRHRDDLLGDGKSYEEAQIAETSCAAAYGFTAKEAPRYLADRRIRSSSPFAKGKRLVLRWYPARARRRHRPVEPRADELPRRLHPSVGNVILQPSEITLRARTVR